jgi:hypothetical protein
VSAEETAMARRMPYRATTATGNRFDFEFALHPETDSPVAVANLLSALLEALDREIGHLGRVGNGDVLQALAMAMAVRTRMLGRSSESIDQLTRDLLDAALASPVTPSEGNVPPDSDPEVH